MKTSILTRWTAAAAVAVASLVALPAAPSSANQAGTDVVISEIYVNGGSAGATYLNKFVELYNPTSAPIDVDGWSVQYRSASGTAAFSGVTPLGDRHIEPGGRLLVSGNSNAANGTALPTPDVTGTTSFSGSAGTLALSRSTTPLSGAAATVLADSKLVDLVGYGTSTTFEGAVKSSGVSVTASLNRTAVGTDTDDNSKDFTSAAPTPVACGTACNGSGTPPQPATEKTIAQVQGTGPDSPLAGSDVITTGVVTAVYDTGGFSGAYIQTDGTGGALDLTKHTASDGLFVFSSAFAGSVSKGDLVKVEGTVSEFNGLTELTTRAGKFSTLDTPAVGVEPSPVTFPLAEAAKESLEGQLLAPQGDFTITNNFATNNYSEIGLAPGDHPFDTPTNVVAPGAPAAALAAQNAADLVTLDDGASLNFLSAANQGTPLPWLTPTNQVRVGQKLTFDDPVVLDFRNSLWKLQPTEQLVAGADEPVVFGPGTRTDAPKDVGGAVKIGTFNVLNYFTTTATAYDAGPGACTYYTDRDGNPVTANRCGNPSTSSGNGPRGAADAASLQRQQDKIVHAINALDADVVSLEEIENSAQFGEPRDAALDTLVAALNADAGAGTWAAVPSPAQLPDLADQDLIRTAFIYHPDVVRPVGDSRVLDVPAFDDAREPLAQAFRPKDGPAASTFAVIVNHFKSKGSGSGADADQGDGQGASNASRTAQATALVAFADDVAETEGTDQVFLTGDFNAYNREDPVAIIEAAGFVNVPAELTDKETYQFDGAVGSLDHVFASEAAFAGVTGADIWNINSYESVAREYSRHNYNVTDLYRPDPYRASDHDPEIVGFDPDATLDRSTTTAQAPAAIRSGEDLTVKVTVASGDSAPTGTITVTDGGAEVGSGTLTDGRVDVAIDPLAIGTHSLVVSYGGDARHAASSASVLVSVQKATADLATTVDPSSYGTSAVVHVTGAPGASGLVYVGNGDDVVGSGTLSGGVADISIDRTLVPGDYDLTVYYAGNGSFDPADTAVDLTVTKAPTKVTKVSVSPTKIVKNKTKPVVTMSVTGSGFVVDGGTVTLRRTGSDTTYTGTVVDGRVSIRLGVFRVSGSAKEITATYDGNEVALGSSTSFTVKVVSR